MNFRTAMASDLICRLVG
uniref:MIP33039p1 n=1 Tax=Drosophila melanogaster TaxID=7227 RepID=G4LU04_DROME|nr:MIP33039p1 [Drosophila melanogaster]